jgi:hypothetical protein
MNEGEYTIELFKKEAKPLASSACGRATNSSAVRGTSCGWII